MVHSCVQRAMGDTLLVLLFSSLDMEREDRQSTKLGRNDCQLERW